MDVGADRGAEHPKPQAPAETWTGSMGLTPEVLTVAVDRMEAPRVLVFGPQAPSG